MANRAVMGGWRGRFRGFAVVARRFPIWAKGRGCGRPFGPASDFLFFPILDRLLTPAAGKLLYCLRFSALSSSPSVPLPEPQRTPTINARRRSALPNFPRRPPLNGRLRTIKGAREQRSQ